MEDKIAKHYKSGLYQNTVTYVWSHSVQTTLLTFVVYAVQQQRSSGARYHRVQTYLIAQSEIAVAQTDSCCKPPVSIR